MIKKVLSIVAMGALLFVTIPPVFGQQSVQQKSATPENVPIIPPPPPPGGGGPRIPVSLSVAVAQTMQAKMLTLNNQLQANHATAAAYSAAATAAQAYFANSAETGWTAIMQAWILANPALFTSQNPTTAQLEAGYAQLQAQGAVVTYSQYVQMITGDPLADRESFLSFVQTNGLAAFHANLVTALNVLSAQVITRHHGGVMIQVNTWSFSWGAAALYLGVVALACTGPVGIAIAVAGLAAGAIGVAGDD